MSFFFFFFFQAEDGIRDHCVTGVQTCALPISRQPEPGVEVPHAGILQRDDHLSPARYQRRKKYSLYGRSSDSVGTSGAGAMSWLGTSSWSSIRPNCASGVAPGPHSIMSARARSGTREASTAADGKSIGVIRARKCAPQPSTELKALTYGNDSVSARVIEAIVWGSRLGTHCCRMPSERSRRLATA